MRDPKRLDKFYRELNKIHQQYCPDWRYFQFMSNVWGWIQSEKKVDPWFLEEDKAIEYINEFMADSKTY